MNKQTLNRIFLILPGILALLAFSAFTILYPGGSPGGYTGSPGDGKNCTQCHNGTATNQTGILSSNVPVAGYTPGSTYSVTVTVSGTGNKGFEVSPQNASGMLIGSLIIGTNTALKNANKSITQTMTTGVNPAAWSFQWVAPSPGMGDVTFYGAVSSSKSKTYLTTMIVKQNTGSSVHENGLSSLKLYPNPVSDLMHLNFYLEKKSDVSVSIISTDGKAQTQLMSKTLNEGNHQLDFDLSDKLEPGIYFLLLNINGKKTVKKFYKG